ncbi:MAG: A24 family peptidase [Pseudomonadota bacterium]
MALDNLMVFGTAAVVMLAWVGLSVGSFLNVVIYRLPVMLERAWTRIAREHLHEVGQTLPESTDAPEGEAPFNLAVPRSRCPECGTPIRIWQNIPVLSWLLLRGRCAACAAPIPVRYLAIELLTGLVSIAVIATFSFSGFGYAALFFTWVLVAAAFIDFDTQLLPDQLTQPLLWTGLLVNSGAFPGLANPFGVSPADAILGAVVGYGSLWTVYWVFKLVTGKEGMGFGDFKLLGAICAWLGWQVLPATILMASISGLIYALIGMLRKRQAVGQPMPFGPFLAIGGWVCLIYRDTVLNLFSL